MDPANDEVLDVLIQELGDSSDESSSESGDEDNSCCSSSSDDEDLIDMQPTKHPKIEGYVANVVSQYNETDFRSHFRMSRRSVEVSKNFRILWYPTLSSTEWGAGVFFF
uniref:Uncharacterized protein n=1 Tax=Cacopsylla melanoneura TaxID=428564 RepID=A0A8D8RM30_9HEMI